jgi:hypothetical protein
MQAGDVAVIFDSSDKFLSVGLFDPFSPIRVRMLGISHQGACVALLARARMSGSSSLDCSTLIVDVLGHQVCRTDMNLNFVFANFDL